MRSTNKGKKTTSETNSSAEPSRQALSESMTTSARSTKRRAISCRAFPSTIILTFTYNLRGRSEIGRQLLMFRHPVADRPLSAQKRRHSKRYLSAPECRLCQFASLSEAGNNGYVREWVGPTTATGGTPRSGRTRTSNRSDLMLGRDGELTQSCPPRSSAR